MPSVINNNLLRSIKYFMPRITALFFLPTALLLSTLHQEVSAQQRNRPVSAGIFSPTVNTAIPVYSSGSGGNYVRTWDAKGPIKNVNDLLIADPSGAKQTTYYSDGLGRDLQTVSRQMSPGGKDIVVPFLYDEFGRIVYQYLPYTSNETNGQFKLDPFNSQKAFMQIQYPGEKVYYSQAEYEASPLNRITKSMAPGNSWAGSNRGISNEHLVNKLDDGVRVWKIANDQLTYNLKDVSTNIPYWTATGTYYNEGELYKNVTIDEAGNKVIEYKDKEGLVILKKVEIEDPLSVPPSTGVKSDIVLDGLYSGLHQAYNSIILDVGFVSGESFTAEIVGRNNFDNMYVGYLSTYYVYDEKKQLRFVMPPKAVAQLIVNNWQFTDHIINEICYRYEYDDQKRMIAKKAPGVDWVYMVYDKRDRMVFSQDAGLRQNGQWMTTLYDGFNRPVLTGLTNWNSGTPADLQFNVSRQTSIDGQSVIDGITITQNPILSGASFIALTKTYYDNYRWTNKEYTDVYNGLLDAGSSIHPIVPPLKANFLTNGLVTGSKIRVMSNPVNLAAGSWLTTVNFLTITIA
jgi:hypothetical protein